MGMGTQNGVKYVVGDKGKFYLSSDKERATPNDYVDGYISKANFKDSSFEYEGKTIKKRSLSINLKDGEDTYNVQIDTKSRGYATVVGQLLNIDLDKKVTFIAKARDLPSGKVATDMFITQDGGVKSAFSKENGRYELPRWKEVEFEGEKKFDRKEYFDKIEEIITKDFFSKITEEPTQKAQETTDEVDSEYNEDEDGEDSLPF